MALVDFFRVISENLNMISYIKYVDITNYICEVFIKNLFLTEIFILKNFFLFDNNFQKVFGETACDEYLLATKKLPVEKIFNVNPTKVR